MLHGGANRLFHGGNSRAKAAGQQGVKRLLAGEQQLGRGGGLGGGVLHIPAALQRLGHPQAINQRVRQGKPQPLVGPGQQRHGRLRRRKGGGQQRVRLPGPCQARVRPLPQNFTGSGAFGRSRQKKHPGRRYRFFLQPAKQGKAVQPRQRGVQQKQIGGQRQRIQKRPVAVASAAHPLQRRLRPQQRLCLQIIGGGDIIPAGHGRVPFLGARWKFTKNSEEIIIASAMAKMPSRVSVPVFTAWSKAPSTI